MARRDWDAILDRAAEIVESYDTGVTLRQLYYRLVSEGVLRNTQAEYSQLSSRTAAARRDNDFPALIDNTRTIHRALGFSGPHEALDALASQYRRDRTEGQKRNVYMAVEKDGLTTQLRSWFDQYSVRVVALRGYTSQSFVERVVDDVAADGRPAVLIYGGDFDPSGEDILRDFTLRTDCWSTVVKVALTPEQVDLYKLPEYPGKATDSRASGFEERHGKLVQVELDALPPDVLHRLYATAFRRYFDKRAYDKVVTDEHREAMNLQRLARDYRDPREDEE